MVARNASSPSAPPPGKPLLPGWRLTAAEIETRSRHVVILPEMLPDVLPWLAQDKVNDAWRSYVGPVDAAAPDLSRLFFELALTISQFGGFVCFRSDGSIAKWKRDGSGIKAILATLSNIRAAQKLPGIDIHADHDRELAHFFIRAPFAQERLDMLVEVGTKRSRTFFDQMLKLARRRDGAYRFNVLHMQGLACRFPLSFGEDPVFYKKASLLLMTMEIALNQLGCRAVSETLPPADYRIPQILEGLGILKFSNDVAAKIRRGHIFSLDDPEVQAIRSATIEAVGLIKDRYERHHGRKTTCAELDGMLYLLSRNRPLMTRATMKPHMIVATHAF